MGLVDPRDPNSLSAKLRRRRDIQLRTLISAVASTRSDVSILDMGGTYEYWQRVGLDFLREKRVKITLVNKFATEFAGEGSDFEGNDDMFSSAVGDACDLSQYADKSFDLTHSNSVIEHLETWANMKAFARETRRLADNYYVQTPYFWFPIDPHYYKMPLFHWFPRPTRATLLMAFPIAFSGKISTVDLAFDVVDRARLLDRRQFRFLFPDAEVRFERFAGLPKSLMGLKAPKND